MSGLGECVYQDGLEEGMEQCRAEGIKALILDNLEEKIPRERILI